MTCVSTGGPNSATKVSNPFTVQFLGVDCSQKLLPKALSINAQIAYISSTATSSTNIGDQTAFFQNDDVVACPISSCTLQNSNGNVNIKSTQPWMVSAFDNQFAPVTLTLTVTCTARLASVVSNSFQVQFLGVDCS